MNDKMYIEQTDTVFDAIVVGSGITGGWAAKEFCERGLNTLMIERGRVVKHREDYPGEGKGPWEFPNRSKVDNLLVEQDFHQQKNVMRFTIALSIFLVTTENCLIRPKKVPTSPGLEPINSVVSPFCGIDKATDYVKTIF
ncbi:hypothetical protein [Psychrosphaera algicola]|uniref:GMC family oxidoreductase n=1 Tax=Psychrosphaera algicola TaxID=3023714 RepID=A0ABT5FDW4_9GAMM|nr:hypothetical protein [Psychrosphaera sp. G1-22]MDC2889709.1 hypothetical protein [Psychrosphaera sp. G1-22]